MSEPEVKGHVVRALEGLLHARYPLSAWWWLGKGDIAGGCFPEWSSLAFQHEAGQWLALSEDTVNQDDIEMQSWGRYARLTLARIHDGVWRQASGPLTHARQVTTLLPLVDPHGMVTSPTRVLAQLADWLLRTKETSLGDYWGRTMMDLSGAALRDSLKAWTRPTEVERVPWALHMDRAQMALREYERSRLRAVGDDPISTSWMPTAHVSLDEWRQRRQQIGVFGERPLTLTENEVLRFPTEIRDVIHPQWIIVPGLRSAWYRPQSERDVFWYGECQTVSLSIAILLSLWFRRAKLSPVSWPLASAPFVLGGLMALVAQVRQADLDWEPSRGGHLTEWHRQQEALAGAEAWLWLEQGPPDQVVEWLSLFIGRPRALAVVPAMKVSPGRYMMALRVRDAYLQAYHGSGLSHPLWEAGPLALGGLFVGPNGTP